MRQPQVATASRSYRTVRNSMIDRLLHPNESAVQRVDSNAAFAIATALVCSDASDIELTCRLQTALS